MHKAHSGFWQLCAIQIYLLHCSVIKKVLSTCESDDHVFVILVHQNDFCHWTNQCTAGSSSDAVMSEADSVCDGKMSRLLTCRVLE